MTRGSSGRSSGRSAPAPVARRSQSPIKSAPQSNKSTNTVAQQPVAQPPSATTMGGGGGSTLGGLMGTMASGLAFGTGTAIAHKAVNAVADTISGCNAKEDSHLDPSSVSHSSTTAFVAPDGPCDTDSRSFQSCITSNSSNVDACNHSFKALQACQRNHQFM